MGSFSWLYATTSCKQANINDGKRVKLLIPQEFTDTYGAPALTGELNDYGEFDTTVKGTKYTLDLYGVLAFFNKHMSEYHGKTIESEWVRDKNPMGLSDTTENRSGIGIGCYVIEILCSDFPLKIVPLRYQGTYETCPGVSFNDPHQGCGCLTWKSKVGLTFSGDGRDPINLSERTSAVSCGLLDKDGNKTEKFYQRVKESDGIIKQMYEKSVDRDREKYMLYKAGMDKFYGDNKNLGDVVNAFWDMRNNITKYPNLMQEYRRFWCGGGYSQKQPNPPKHPLCDLPNVWE